MIHITFGTFDRFNFFPHSEHSSPWNRKYQRSKHGPVTEKHTSHDLKTDVEKKRHSDPQDGIDVSFLKPQQLPHKLDLPPTPITVANRSFYGPHSSKRNVIVVIGLLGEG